MTSPKGSGSASLYVLTARTPEDRLIAEHEGGSRNVRTS